jgi:hypothetical protein
VASAKSVSAGKGDDFLVVEAHPVEDEPQVVLGLRGVRQPSVGRHVVLETVNPASPPRDGRSARLLDSDHAPEGPEVTVGDPRELLLDLLHVIPGVVLPVSESRYAQNKRAHQTVVRAVRSLGLESHRGVVGASRVVFLVKGAGAVPRKTN